MMPRLPPAFIDNVGQKLSATDLNLLIKATQQIESYSLIRMPTFDNSGGDQGNPYYQGGGGYHSQPPFRVWKGGCLSKAGATTLTVSGAATPAGSEMLRFYVNGALAATIGPPIPASWSTTIALGALAANEPIWLEVKVEGSASTRFARYYVYEAYIDPISMSGWVAPESFTDSIFTAAKLEAIKSAIRWLYNRLNLIPSVPRLAQRTALGPWRDPVEKPEMANWSIYYGTVLKSYANTDEVWRVYIQYTNYTNVQERWHLYYNGALAYSSPIHGPGTYFETATVPLTHALGTRAEVWILAQAIEAHPDRNLQRASRYEVLQSRTEAATAYPYWTPPAPFSYGLWTDTSVRNALNAIVDKLVGIKDRIDTRPWLFSRHYLQRKFYGWDDTTHGVLHKRALPHVVRRGERLHVYGKGVTMGFGPTVAPSDPEEPPEAYTFLRQENLVASDTLAHQHIYLNTYPDLAIGMAYQLITEFDVLAEEYLS